MDASSNLTQRTKPRSHDLRRRRPRRRRARGWFSRRPGLALWLWIASYALAAAIGGLVVMRLGASAPRVIAATGRVPDPLRTPPRAYDWMQQPDPLFPVPPYARFLEEVEFVLDPGHIGQRDRPGWKRGPTGLREAEANFRVTRFLREFLEAAGARVLLTRDEDRSLELSDEADLADRVAIANRARPHLLISIHHNAGAAEANYTTVFYHKSADHNPASLTAARHLLVGLNDALRLPQHLECALINDEILFRSKEGLRVLRDAECPAVLVESSFHTNPAEEQRLRDPTYNRREAYGLFLGLARWAQAGLPAVRLLDPTDGRAKRGGKVTIALDDGVSQRGGWGSESVKILSESLTVRLNGRPTEFDGDLARGRISVTLPRSAATGAHQLSVNFTTVFGQHVLYPRLDLQVQ